VEEEFTSRLPDENVNILVPLLQQYKAGRVYDTDHKLIGQVSRGNLLKKYQPEGSLDAAIEKAITMKRKERRGPPPVAGC